MTREKCYYVAQHCPACKGYHKVKFQEGKDICCLQCKAPWGKINTIGNVFERCPFCGCRQFYRDKDFHQALGCMVMLIGIVLVPKTYGLSLPVFAFIDWMLYRKYPNMAVCYKCGLEFHGFSIPERIKKFMHHIGLKYDKFH
jgi:hypothetical protein